ncbi:MAG: cobalamin B12-binding domain-containing protein [Elusimicrobia bacterium]|nr:cobalamin B12-binding domain-containing protein [Elusimicrobiota bacterium]
MSDRIVLLFPPDSAKPYREFEAIGSLLPPMGVASMAACLRQQGFPVSLIDGMAEGLGVDEAVERILAADPAVLGISMVSAVVFLSEEIARKVKERKPSVVVVVGGAHVSAVPEETLTRMRHFDIGIIGEGEKTIVELVRALKASGGRPSDLGGVDGIIYRKGSELVRTKPRAYIDDLDTLPFPAYDLLPDLRAYRMPGDNLKRLPTTSVVASRGCPKECTFCDRATFGRRFRSHGTDYLIRLVKHLVKEYGIKDIGFHDDNLVANPPKLRAFCQRLIDEKLDLTWSCYGSVDFVKEEDFRLMKSAGCWQISWGLESGSKKMLDNYRKNVTVERMMKVLDQSAAAGIDNRGFFILGGFGETVETMEETLAFLKRAPLVNFHITYFTAYPGSEASKTAREHGEYDDDWRLLNSFQPNFVPNTTTREDLDRYFQKFYKAFYFRPRIFGYWLRKLWHEPALLKTILKGFAAMCRFTMKKPAEICRRSEDPSG